jgi:hypothetical protein
MANCHAITPYWTDMGYWNQHPRTSDQTVVGSNPAGYATGGGDITASPPHLGVMLALGAGFRFSGAIGCISWRLVIANPALPFAALRACFAV